MLSGRNAYRIIYQGGKTKPHMRACRLCLYMSQFRRLVSCFFYSVVRSSFPLRIAVWVTGAGVNTVVTVAVYNKALRLSRVSLEGPRLGQALNFQARSLRGACVFSYPCVVRYVYSTLCKHEVGCGLVCASHVFFLLYAPLSVYSSSNPTGPYPSLRLQWRANSLCVRVFCLF